jgi:L-ascorbate metabolism protein UlaG (beta-lactamase superfamily)
MSDARITYVGGPTALIELGGLVLLTDPTFDPAGSTYPTATSTLRKQTPPALAASSIGPVDAVLLSHDHHADNLDAAGRALLPEAGVVLSTHAAAARLGARTVGRAPWEALHLPAPTGRTLVITSCAGSARPTRDWI